MPKNRLDSPRTVWFYLDQLEVGGPERILVNLLGGLLRASSWKPVLVLNQVRGVLLDAVPAEVPILDLGARTFRGALGALARSLRETPPQVLVSQRGYLNAIAVLAHTVSASSSRLVLMDHTLPSRGLSERRMPSRPIDHALNLIAPLLYRRAHVVAGISRGVASELERTLLMPRGRVQVIYNPAVPEAPDLAERMAAPLVLPWPDDGVPLVVTVGRLSPEKGFDMLLEAFARLRAQQRARLAIIGEGAEYQALASLAEARGLRDSVHFAGYQANPYPWLRRASAFALSSVIESFPTVLLEAMAAGVPVVAFDCPEGPREILTSEASGLLVPPRDPVALAEGLRRVLSDPALAARLTEGGRRRAQDFTFDRAVMAYDRLFTSLVSEPSALRSMA